MSSRLFFGLIFTIDSTELISFSWKRSFNIQTLSTVALAEITQPGNLSPIELSISATIRYQASIKFTTITNALTAKSLEPLNFLNRELGNYYFSDLRINSNELDDTGDVLHFDCEMTFISNQNFQ